MALDRQGQLSRQKAGAVVGHQDARQAAAIGLDLDVAPAGIESVFYQLLNRASRALDHLAGGDAVDEFWGQAPDGHGRTIGAILERRAPLAREHV